MATTTLFQPAVVPERAALELSGGRGDRTYAVCLVTALTAVALAIHGFHPYAEDGGLYLAGVKRVLDPSLYSKAPDFVLGHLRFSVFAPAMAWVVRASGVRLEAAVFIIYLSSIWMTLACVWLLAERCFVGRRERTGAVALVAMWMTMPVAGTSLMLMDPYVTARSVSTPLVLVALLGAMQFFESLRNDIEPAHGSLALALSATGFAAMVHPLMAGYGVCCVLALGISTMQSRRARLGAMVGLGALALLMAAVLTLMSEPTSAEYRSVALTRSYWFLSQWRWFEIVGLTAPVAILAQVWRRGSGEARALAQMGVVAGVIAIAVAAIFARTDAASLDVARLQPLRVFQMVYLVMVLLVGGWLVRWMRKWPALWVAALGLSAVGMFFAERKTFPASAHIELGATENEWERAFSWISQNTPKDAVFALDADYITKLGEDAQGFRAIAERTSLPDYSKDGGEAAITPELSEAWRDGEEAQKGLSARTDEERLTRLAPRNVSWVVLEHRAMTGFDCAYTNNAVKVCRLPGNVLAEAKPDARATDGLKLSWKKRLASRQPLKATR